MGRLLSGVRSGMTSLLVAGALAGFAASAGAQGLSAGGGGGGGGGTSGAGFGGTTLTGTGGIGTSAPIGSGNISALKNGATGLSSLGVTTSAKNSSNAIPSSADSLAPYYDPPLLLPTTSSTAAFGQPQYPITTTNTPAVKTTSGKQTSTGFTTFNYVKSPVYVTTLSEELPVFRHAAGALRANLQDVLARSSSLQSPGRIGVNVLDGGLVVLTGSVSTPRERRLAASLLSLTPGVRRVQNELIVNP